jgi:hypothetical protein
MMNPLFGSYGHPHWETSKCCKHRTPHSAANANQPNWLANAIAARSLILRYVIFAESGQPRHPERRQIKLDWQRSNWDTHLRFAPLKSVQCRRLTCRDVSCLIMRTPSHQCGTARMGTGSAAQVVDTVSAAANIRIVCLSLVTRLFCRPRLPWNQH